MRLTATVWQPTMAVLTRRWPQAHSLPARREPPRLALRCAPFRENAFSRYRKDSQRRRGDASSPLERVGGIRATVISVTAAPDSARLPLPHEHGGMIRNLFLRYAHPSPCSPDVCGERSEELVGGGSPHRPSVRERTLFATTLVSCDNSDNLDSFGGAWKETRLVA